MVSYQQAIVLRDKTFTVRPLEPHYLWRNALSGLPGWGGLPLPHLSPPRAYGALQGPGLEAGSACLRSGFIHLRVDPGPGPIPSRRPPVWFGLPPGSVHGDPGLSGA